ncbi:MAG TPA: AI-2E family transporter YdiK [Candidatus Binatia bacterium]|nr:AI-2E family transporter YdiK [Candidatus Binatia bacterium]
MNAETAPDLTRSTLQLLFVGVLIAGTFWILEPFLVPLAWAATIAVSTWPVFLRVLSWSGGRRGIAVTFMTLTLMLVFVVPLYLAVTTILDNTGVVVEWSRSAATLVGPEPPSWIAGLPYVGPRTAARWREIAAGGPGDLSERLLPYARTLVAWFAGRVGGVGRMLLDFLLTVVIAAILYANGDTAAGFVDRFARRLAGVRGAEAAVLAAQAVRAVALGVVVTALLQSCLGGVGLAVAGIRFVAILTAIMFILGIAQIGPLPVLVPAIAWTYWASGGFWGTALLAWSVIVGLMDNVLRPVLIRRGAHLPLLLIFTGVIGGLIAFGVIGLFVGPVILAVAYTLLLAWMDDAPPPASIDASQRRARTSA